MSSVNELDSSSDVLNVKPGEEDEAPWRLLDQLSYCQNLVLLCSWLDSGFFRRFYRQISCFANTALVGVVTAVFSSTSRIRRTNAFGRRCFFASKEQRVFSFGY